MSLEKNIINGTCSVGERTSEKKRNNLGFCNDILTKWRIKWRLIELEESHLN